MSIIDSNPFSRMQDKIKEAMVNMQDIAKHKSVELDPISPFTLVRDKSHNIIDLKPNFVDPQCTLTETDIANYLLHQDLNLQNLIRMVDVKYEPCVTITTYKAGVHNALIIISEMLAELPPCGGTNVIHEFVNKVILFVTIGAPFTLREGLDKWLAITDTITNLIHIIETTFFEDCASFGQAIIKALKNENVNSDILDMIVELGTPINIGICNSHIISTLQLIQTKLFVEPVGRGEGILPSHKLIAAGLPEIALLLLKCFYSNNGDPEIPITYQDTLRNNETIPILPYTDPKDLDNYVDSILGNRIPFVGRVPDILPSQPLPLYIDDSLSHTIGNAIYLCLDNE